MNQKPSGWTSPSSLLGIVGFAAIVLAGYREFQDDIGDKLAALQTRVAVNEARLNALDRQLDQIQRHAEREGDLNDVARATD